MIEKKKTATCKVAYPNERRDNTRNVNQKKNTKNI